MINIAVFVGSLREKSFNVSLAHILEKLAGENVTFHYVDINLPLFNQDLEAAYPAEAQRGKDIVEAADGVLFITPEFNRGVPGVLKNAVDWISRPWGKSSFVGKPTAITGASVSPTGTALAQYQLRQAMTYLDVKLMGAPELMIAGAGEAFDENGVLTDERWLKNTKAFIDAFVAFVEHQK
jgi:chromate reductase